MGEFYSKRHPNARLATLPSDRTTGAGATLANRRDGGKPVVGLVELRRDHPLDVVLKRGKIAAPPLCHVE